MYYIQSIKFYVGNAPFIVTAIATTEATPIQVTQSAQGDATTNVNPIDAEVTTASQEITERVTGRATSIETETQTGRMHGYSKHCDIVISIYISLFVLL